LNLVAEEREPLVAPSRAVGRGHLGNDAVRCPPRGMKEPLGKAARRVGGAVALTCLFAPSGCRENHDPRPGQQPAAASNSAATPARQASSPGPSASRVSKSEGVPRTLALMFEVLDRAIAAGVACPKDNAWLSRQPAADRLDAWGNALQGACVQGDFVVRSGAADGRLMTDDDIVLGLAEYSSPR